VIGKKGSRLGKRFDRAEKTEVSRHKLASTLSK
jgi:hypothetical protein